MQGGALPFWRDGGFRRLASRDAPIAGRAQCQSARYAPCRPQAPCCARDRKGVGHCGATTEPDPLPALRSRIATGGGADDRSNQPSPPNVSRETSVLVSLFGAYLGQAFLLRFCAVFTQMLRFRGTRQRARRRDKGRPGKTLAIREGARAAGPYPQHLGENRTLGRTWMADAASASHSVVRRPRRPPSDRGIFHVKHSFVAWGGTPRAPPERGAASATRCGPGSLSFGRTSGGRTRLRAYLAPR